MKMFVNVLTPFAFGHLRLALVVSHKNPDGKRASTEQTHVIIRLNNITTITKTTSSLSSTSCHLEAT